MKCRVTCTVIPGRCFFTVEESAWLSRYVSETGALTKKRGKGVGKARGDFYNKVIAKFLEQFPYRDPEAYPNIKFTKEQASLVMTAEDRVQLRNRIRSVLSLRSRKRSSPKSKKSPRSRTAGSSKNNNETPSVAGSTDAEGEDDDEQSTDHAIASDGDGGSGDSAAEGDGDGDGDSSVDDGDSSDDGRDGKNHKGKSTRGGKGTTKGKAAARAPEKKSARTQDNPVEALFRRLGPQFKTTATGVTDLEFAVNLLRQMEPGSWAEVEELTLRDRQQQLLGLTQGLIDFLGRATGAEMHLEAVWHDGEDLRMGCASTSRDWLVSQASAQSREDFVGFVEETVGSTIITSLKDAPPAVVGDPDNGLRPLLPPMSTDWVVERRVLLAFFEYLWPEWQGGRNPVPWSRFKSDGQKKRYYLIEQHRLPEGIAFLEEPLDFSEEDTWTWARALRSPEYTGLRLFQFRQPRPGVIDEETRTVMASNSQMRFTPTSLLYMRHLIDVRGPKLDRWDGLPVVPVQPPVLFDENSMEWALGAAGGQAVLTQLVQYLTAYEAFGPYQADRGDWEELARQCRHLKSELPSPTIAGDHLVCELDHNGPQLPRAFFDSSDSAHEEWGLAAVLDFISGEAFMHRSGSLMAGPYGYKWGVILLLHLYACGEKIRAGRGPQYGGWREADTTEVLQVADGLMARVKASVKCLVRTKADRENAQSECEPTTPKELCWEPLKMVMTAVGGIQDKWESRNLAVSKYKIRPAGRSSQPASHKSSSKRDRESIGREGGAASADEGGVGADQPKAVKRARAATSEPDDSGEPTAALSRYHVLSICILR
ncbi:hypothetical protein FRC08_018529 [Ceratobasidium sp. 394]|nr:hypothetical protein FRC08_018529 [Ceratobasidium sp. 394]